MQNLFQIPNSTLQLLVALVKLLHTSCVYTCRIKRGIWSQRHTILVWKLVFSPFCCEVIIIQGFLKLFPFFFKIVTISLLELVWLESLLAEWQKFLLWLRTNESVLGSCVCKNDRELVIEATFWHQVRILREKHHSVTIIIGLTFHQVRRVRFIQACLMNLTFIVDDHLLLLKTLIMFVRMILIVGSFWRQSFRCTDQRVWIVELAFALYWRISLWKEELLVRHVGWVVLVTVTLQVLVLSAENIWLFFLSSWLRFRGHVMIWLKRILICLPSLLISLFASSICIILHQFWLLDAILCGILNQNLIIVHFWGLNRRMISLMPISVAAWILQRV